MTHALPASPLWIGPTSGRAPHLETLLASLTASRHFLLSATRELRAEDLSAPPRAGTNTIGMLLAHVAAAERMFQNITGKGHPFGMDESAFARAFRFEDDWLRGSGIDAYHDHLATVRAATVTLFAAKDDVWLETPRTFARHASNHHYYWLHFLMDEARHTGQIMLLRKYLLPTSDPRFDPYAAL